MISVFVDVVRLMWRLAAAIRACFGSDNLTRSEECATKLFVDPHKSVSEVTLMEVAKM